MFAVWFVSSEGSPRLFCDHFLAVEHVTHRLDAHFGDQGTSQNVGGF